MKTMSLCPIRSLVFVALLLCWPVLVRAQLDFTLDMPTQTGVPGGELLYTGTLTNTGSAPLFLTGDNFILDGIGLTVDDLPFLTEAPAFLESNASYSGSLFRVFLDVDVLPQNGLGYFSVLGGADESAWDTLGSVQFGVSVVPEPGAWTLFIAGGLFGAGVLFRYIQ